jgi:hypothetical protein
MSILNNVNLRWSAYNSFSNRFDKIVSNKPLDAMSDDEVSTIVDNATSCQVFISDENDVAPVMEELRSIREMLGWKGEITDGSTSYEDKKSGKIVKGFRVGFNREPSRSMGILAFKDRLAGIAR